MIKPTVLLALLAAGSACLAAQPVQTYTREADPSRSEGLRSIRPLIPAGDPRSGLLITPAPHPAARTDDADRLQNGRTWVTRGPVGSRTPISELTRTSPGPASYGADQAEHDRLIFVQPSRLRSVVAISPFQQIDANTLAQIQRLEPNLGRTPGNPESAQLLSDLRLAQHQWLKEEGYILRVRTHENSGADDGSNTQASSEGQSAPQKIQPRGVIRVLPAPQDAQTGRIADASASPSDPAPAH